MGVIATSMVSFKPSFRVLIVSVEVSSHNDIGLLIVFILLPLNRVT